MTETKICKIYFILSFHKNKWKWRWICQWHLLEDKSSWQEPHFVALISVHKWLLCSTQLYKSKYIGAIGHVNLVAITGPIILVPYLEVKLLQLIWRSGTTQENELQKFDFMIGYQDSSPSNVCQGDMVCWIEMRMVWNFYTWKKKYWITVKPLV